MIWPILALSLPHNLGPSSWLHGYWVLVVDIASIGGLVFSLWSLLRISRVAHALRRERRALNSLLRLEEVTSLMRAAAEKLSRGRAPDTALANQISESVGVVDGVIDALRMTEREPREPTGDLRGAADAALIKDYFGFDMLRDAIDAAETLVDILVFRPHIVTNVEVNALLHEATKRGVEVRVLSLSSDAPAPLLQEVCWILPNPRVTDVSVLRVQLEAAATFYADNVIGRWGEQELSRYDHRLYTHYPTVHYLRSDDILYVGFSATESGTQPDDKRERTALEVGVDTRLGQQLVAHYKALFESSESIFAHGHNATAAGESGDIKMAAGEMPSGN